MKHYDHFNREERAICAHLFRLLHESLDKESDSPFGQLIDLMAERKLIPGNNTEDHYIPDYTNTAIYTEVAIIRDYFKINKESPNDFMDNLVALIMAQENTTLCRLYSGLDEPLNNPRLTHPRQIRQKAEALKIGMSKSEIEVYGALQGMFNAKPDLVLTVDNKLIVIEAKFTEKFDDGQLKRTKNIAQVWAELLYQELGFTQKPDYTVVKLGASKSNADITWTDIGNIARLWYPTNDRSMIALEAGLKLLQARGDE